MEGPTRSVAAGGSGAVVARWRACIAFLAVLLLASLPWPSRADELDRYIAQQTKVHRFPGVVLGVLRDGRLVDVRARGMANVELGVRADRRHRFEIGSISKQFTAYAVLVLHERGLVDLQAPVGRYLDGLPAAWAAVPIERLLTHTSGLPDLESAFGYGVYREMPGDAEFLARLVALPIDFAPGDRWSYSNTNYWLLARVIEQVSGQGYGEFMRRNIFQPLQMSSTRSSRPSQLLPGRASGYRRVGERLENREPSQPHTARGLGDIVSSLDDMARWEREQLRPTLVSSATAELARQPAKLNDGSTFPYGYGLDLDNLLPRPSIQHTGQMAGFTAAYVRVPALRLAAVVFVNAYGSPVDSLAIHALRQAEPSLRLRPWRPIPDADPEITRRVHELLDRARSADTAWREEWFTPEYWKEIRPWLGEVAETAARFGPLRRLVLVGRQDQGEERGFVYRADYAELSRVIRYRVDGRDRIASRTVLDE